MCFLATPVLAEPITIAALGDSLTAGYGLPTADGFVPQMQAWLDEQGADVTLINAGVSGDTTAGGLSRLDWTLTPDVDGVIVALGGNDFLRGLDPAVSRANLDAILEGAAARDVPAMLVGIQAGSNYGPDYRADFNGMYEDLAESRAVPLFPDWFAAIQGGDGIDTDALQSDGIHPNAQGVSMIVDEMGPAILEFAESLAPE
ncbi:arylesterase [Loktanella sp. TSTF-M6]|uniref:Arylesterase n=1 Tax=Loktanella gaetbuli TaxID=2881335 RepID=A0ABS8BSQ0_9RHOB|nr:arylesterase [Loktanella gaetbuli]MCB5198743.1 arylesterase [Loktanella gaetbuli]